MRNAAIPINIAIPPRVQVALVPCTDNQGEPCQHCSLIDRVNAANIYYADRTTEACLPCAGLLAMTSDVRALEISQSATVAPF
jgi:hypothetical protein